MSQSTETDTVPITAAGGVAFQDDQNNEQSSPKVLLIHRRGMWDLPKGKKEKGENVQACARREVMEEVGLEKMPDILQDLGTTYHEYDRNNNHYGKTTYWFAMQVHQSGNFTPQTEEEIEKVVWKPLDEAREIVGFENLLGVLNQFEKWYASRMEK